MLRPPVRAFRTTQSSAAITCDTSVVPKLSATLTGTMPAPGAIPRNRCRSPASTAGSGPGSRPAMIPAMWVPWPKVSEVPTAAAVSTERFTPGRNRPGPSRPGTAATPESMSATSTPAPALVARQARRAPVTAPLRSSE